MLLGNINLVGGETGSLGQDLGRELGTEFFSFILFDSCFFLSQQLSVALDGPELTLQARLVFFLLCLPSTLDKPPCLAFLFLSFAFFYDFKSTVFLLCFLSAGAGVGHCARHVIGHRLWIPLENMQQVKRLRYQSKSCLRPLPHSLVQTCACLVPLVLSPLALAYTLFAMIQEVLGLVVECWDEAPSWPVLGQHSPSELEPQLSCCSLLSSHKRDNIT